MGPLFCTISVLPGDALECHMTFFELYYVHDYFLVCNTSVMPGSCNMQCVVCVHHFCGCLFKIAEQNVQTICIKFFVKLGDTK